MSDEVSLESLLLLRDQAATHEVEHAARGRLGALVTAGALAFTSVAAVTPGYVAGVLALAWWAAALGVWAWRAHLDRGPKGAARRAAETLARVGTWHEVTVALAAVFRAHHPRRFDALEREVSERHLDAVRAWLAGGDIPADDVVIGAVVELMRAELDARFAEAHALDRVRDVERRLAAMREEASAERERILREALEDADDLRAGRTPRHSPWLGPAAVSAAPPPDAGDLAMPREDVLRMLFAHAARGAERGVVTESPAAAAVLGHPSRWTAYAGTPEEMARLLALFDPIAAPTPPRTRS